MIELPEAVVISKQLNETIRGKKIKKVIAAYSPHKFAWYHGDPQGYKDLLKSKEIGITNAYGSWIEMKAEDVMVSFCEGVNLRFHAKNEKRPPKHQLLIEFEDLTAISASIQMYGGLFCYKAGQLKNAYYLQAKDKPSPLSDQFDYSYFLEILAEPGINGLSAKGLLATKQRIPGLGNGVLQDVLFNAQIHPKKKVNSFMKSDREILFKSIKSTLGEMVSQGGRDTEKDLFGCPGGYITRVSKNTVDKYCSKCASIIKKEAYMGGNIYYCTGCQKL
jgi:formamidopyrimidine-DNA glycosylase